MWPARLSPTFVEDAEARLRDIKNKLLEANIPYHEFELHHGDVYSLPSGTLHLFMTVGDAPVFTVAFNALLAPSLFDALPVCGHSLQSHWVVGLDRYKEEWVHARTWTDTALAGPSGSNFGVIVETVAMMVLCSSLPMTSISSYGEMQQREVFQII